MREEREFTLPNADLKLPFFDLARFGRIGRGGAVWERERGTERSLSRGGEQRGKGKGRGWVREQYPRARRHAS